MFRTAVLPSLPVKKLRLTDMNSPKWPARILNCLSDCTAGLVPLYGTHHGSFPALNVSILCRGM